MKRIIVLITIIFAISNVFAQPTVNPDGYNIFYYPNQVKSSEGYMRQGKPDGMWKTYYPNGIIKSVGKRTSFQLDSVWVFFTEQGDSLEAITYLYGKKNGYYLKYDTITINGKKINFLASKEMYISDVKSGLGTYYFPNGIIKTEIPYVEGKKHGVSKEYNQQGVLVTLKKFHYDQITDIEKINRIDNAGNKQGIWKYFGDNKQMVLEEFYLEGKLEGLRKFYDESGKLIRIERYKSGELVPEEDLNDIKENVIIKDTHFADGRIKTSGSYLNEIPVGVHRTFDSTGLVVQGLVFDSLGVKVAEGVIDKTGKKQGDWKDLFSDGTTRAEGKYKNDKRTGNWKFYYPNGKVEQTGKYLNGKPDGEWKWYYPNGQISREENFEDGLENGIYTEYDEKGTIIAQGNYEVGMREGEWTFIIAQNKLVGTFKEDMREGTWKYYTLDDKLWFEGAYNQGEPDGKHLYYYPNGQVKEEQHYVVGIREKSWKYFTPDGILTTTIVYQNGEEVRIDGQKIK